MIRKQNDILTSWAPMPRYLLRRFIVRNVIRRLKPRDFIEIGAGTGEMAKWMSGRKMAGTVVEISSAAIQMLHARLHETDVKIYAGESTKLSEQADLLLSMEVLEHIKDDRAALKDWFRLTRPGGQIIISVPSRPKLYSIEDKLVGHYRRYERREITEKLESAGFRNPTILSYGFPLTLLLRRLRIFLVSRKQRRFQDQRSMSERTAASGVERDWVWLRWILNDLVFLPFLLLQLLFLRLDWAEGYIAIAQHPVDKSEPTNSPVEYPA